MGGSPLVEWIEAPATPMVEPAKVTVASVVQAPPVVPTPANEAQVEKPIATAIVIERSDEGMIRRSGRFLGRFFIKVSKALRLY